MNNAGEFAAKPWVGYLHLPGRSTTAFCRVDRKAYTAALECRFESRVSSESITTVSGCELSTV